MLNQQQRHVLYLIAKAEFSANPTTEGELQMNELLADVLSQIKPACLRDSPNSILIQLKKSFAKELVHLSQQGCTDTASLTLFDFYSWTESLQEKYEAEIAALKKK